jgi:hypothetical protein
MDGSKTKEAEKNRDQCPDATKVIDAFRSVFGADVKVVYVKEGDVELGRRSVPNKS